MSTPGGDAPVGFRLLFVCTGNICRSPFAEILTRHLLIGRLGGRIASALVVSSAGVRAAVGSGMHPDSRAELAPWGLDGGRADGFRARQLTPDLVDRADLVLGAGPRHRSRSAELAAGGPAKAFAIREFARLVDGVDPALLPQGTVARAHALVRAARARRGLLPPVPPEDDQVPDPVTGGPEVHRQAAELLYEAVWTIVDRIAPPTPGVRPFDRGRVVGVPAQPSGLPAPGGAHLQ